LTLKVTSLNLYNFIAYSQAIVGLIVVSNLSLTSLYIISKIKKIKRTRTY